MRLPEGRLRHRPAATAHRLRVASTLNRADPAAPVDQVVLTPVDPAAQADLRNTRADPVDQAALLAVPVGLVVPADPVDPGNTDLVDLAVLRVDLVGLVGLVDQDTPADTVRVVPAAPVVPVAHGTAMGSVATSTEPHGATDPRPGDTASHPGRDGADRTRRPGGNGITARSITGATRRLPIGIPVSTSGALTSSGCGSRCKA